MQYPSVIVGLQVSVLYWWLVVGECCQNYTLLVLEVSCNRMAEYQCNDCTRLQRIVRCPGFGDHINSSSSASESS